MASAINVDPKILKTLDPLNTLIPSSLSELIAKSKVDKITAHRYLFKQDEQDNCHTFLLSGEVELLVNGQTIGKVVAGSQAASKALDLHQPHHISARALGIADVLRVDVDLLEILLDAVEPGSVLTAEPEVEIDWMTRLFESPLFHWIPAANLQQILMKMESVPISQGQTIIQQDLQGKYFYAVEEGLCAVHRETNGRVTELVKLHPGDTFGEASLVSGLPCNASILALQDGSLMRLQKVDFVSLIQAPIMRWQEASQCAAMVKNGAIWLDIRSIGEYQKGHPTNAQNIPLFELYQRVQQLDTNLEYIVYSNTEQRSAVGIFLLLQNGIDAIGLQGGIASFQKKRKKVQEKSVDSQPDIPASNPVPVIDEQPDKKILAQVKVEREKVKQEAARLVKLAKSKAKEDAERIQKEADARVQQHEKDARLSFEEAYHDLQEEFHELNQELFQANENQHKVNEVLQKYRGLQNDKQKMISLLHDVSVKIGEAAQLQDKEWAKAEQCRDEILIRLEQVSSQFKHQAAEQKYQDVQHELFWLAELVDAIQNIAVPGSVE